MSKVILAGMVADAWFEPDPEAPSALMVALSECADRHRDEFFLPLLGGHLMFRRVATMRGRRVFAATLWLAADAKVQPPPGASLPLSGPFPKGRQDVA